MSTFNKNMDSAKRIKTKPMIFFERIRRLDTTLTVGRSFHSIAYETFTAEYNKNLR